MLVHIQLSEAGWNILKTTACQEKNLQSPSTLLPCSQFVCNSSFTWQQFEQNDLSSFHVSFHDGGMTYWSLQQQVHPYLSWRNSWRLSSSESISYPSTYPVLPTPSTALSISALPFMPALYFYTVTSDRAWLGVFLQCSLLLALMLAVMLYPHL